MTTYIPRDTRLTRIHETIAQTSPYLHRMYATINIGSDSVRYTPRVRTVTGTRRNIASRTAGGREDSRD